MRKSNWTGLIFLLLVHLPVYAFTTVDEQIDHYLSVIETGNYQQKIGVLKSLAWSGITSSRLYDNLETQLLSEYLEQGRDKQSAAVVSHKIRALAFSGNEKYRNTLEEIKTNSANKKNRRHAKIALNQLGTFASWIAQFTASDFSIEGKPFEVATYMKMMSLESMYAQRLGAEGIFQDNQRDPDLLALAAEKLKVLYMQGGLSNEALDTASWLCKAIGQSGESEYTSLLSEIARNTPYKKVRKYALQYPQ